MFNEEGKETVLEGPQGTRRGTTGKLTTRTGLGTGRPDWRGTSGSGTQAGRTSEP
jgi:hypothetical protein